MGTEIRARITTRDTLHTGTCMRACMRELVSLSGRGRQANDIGQMAILWLLHVDTDAQHTRINTKSQFFSPDALQLRKFEQVCFCGNLRADRAKKILGDL